MATLTLQFGQYGNQLGPTFFATMMDYLRESGSSGDATPWFGQASDGSIYTKALMIDMEPKAILKSCLGKNDVIGGKFHYNARSAIFGQSGSGNNWAHGYMEHGPRELPKILESVRKYAEEANTYIDGFFGILSLAGGTGSGLGSYVISHLRDHYPKSAILCNCVVPFASGEVLTQQYNTSLSLASLIQEADGILLFGNDEAATIVKNQQSRLSGARPSLTQLNAVIGRTLAYNLSGLRRPVTDLLEQTVPSVLYKLLAPRVVPSFPSHDSQHQTLRSIVSRCRQMMITGSPGDTCMDWQQRLENRNYFTRLVRSHIVIRSPDAEQFVSGYVNTDEYLQLKDLDPAILNSYTRAKQQDIKSQRQGIKEAYSMLMQSNFYDLYPYYRPGKSDYPISLRGENLKEDVPPSAALVLNGNLFSGTLTSLVLDMKARMQAGAYMWHYERFGVTPTVIRDALITISQVIEDYTLK
ncbi:Delta tubulin [Giardia lamblia P15]|uniref:Delta tubulin n=1 Tax=Giardia intestinalis (strain P15) TaxID=658858 RepID=E1EWA7_GIAIA|nr:Delta tubulin [Giardia lamblia P15]